MVGPLPPIFSLSPATCSSPQLCPPVPLSCVSPPDQGAGQERNVRLISTANSDLTSDAWRVPRGKIPRALQGSAVRGP